MAFNPPSWPSTFVVNVSLDLVAWTASGKFDSAMRDPANTVSLLPTFNTPFKNWKCNSFLEEEPSTSIWLSLAPLVRQPHNVECLAVINWQRFDYMAPLTCWEFSWKAGTHKHLIPEGVCQGDSVNMSQCITQCFQAQKGQREVSR